MVCGYTQSSLWLLGGHVTGAGEEGDPESVREAVIGLLVREEVRRRARRFDKHRTGLQKWQEGWRGRRSFWLGAWVTDVHCSLSLVPCLW